MKKFWKIFGKILLLIVLLLFLFSTLCMCRVRPSNTWSHSVVDDGYDWASKDGTMYMQLHEGLYVCQMLRDGEVISIITDTFLGTISFRPYHDDFWRISRTQWVTAGNYPMEEGSGILRRDWFRVRMGTVFILTKMTPLPSTGLTPKKVQRSKSRMN